MFSTMFSLKLTCMSCNVLWSVNYLCAPDDPTMLALSCRVTQSLWTKGWHQMGGAYRTTPLMTTLPNWPKPSTQLTERWGCLFCLCVL